MTNSVNVFNTEINYQALVTAHETIEIHASKKIIMSILTNILEWPTWRQDISNVQLLSIDNNIRIGTDFEWKSNGLKYHSQIHTCTTTLFGWTGKTIGAYAVHNWKLTTNKSSTTVEVSESLEGLSIRLMKRKMQSELPLLLRKDLHDLKIQCEKIDEEVKND
jgi:hypothetical protein